MRIAENWSDYRIIDTSCGEKLESWGGRLLVRPDPQIIWKTPKKSELWGRADGVYHRSSKGGGEWEFKRKLPDSWNIGYKDLKFIIRPTGFKHTGLFPEQAVNWDYMSRKIREKVSSGRPVKVLNLFAYTGGATLACAHAGAQVTHVDASKGMVQWARDNAALSGLSDRPIRWIVDDCEKFVARGIRRGNLYDGIVMDPPSYGRGPSGEVWKLEDDLWPFVSSVVPLLSDDPLFVLINSYTTGLSPSVLTYIAESLFTKKFGGRSDAQELGLRASASGLVLPCGASCRWER